MRRYTCELRPTTIMSASSPRRFGALGYHSDRVYVHAKVGIGDDRWLTLGSANLNAHSFFSDSEVNVVSCDAALARDTRLRLWATHLEHDIDQVAGDPSTVVDELWRPIAAEQRPARRSLHVDELAERQRQIPRHGASLQPVGDPSKKKASTGADVL
jgi:phosphatidylserine/phosphatidylglycerophosphate/cardiolipin synthase-like enzyme